MAKHILPTVAALALAVTLSACAGKAEYHPLTSPAHSRRCRHRRTS